MRSVGFKQTGRSSQAKQRRKQEMVFRTSSKTRKAHESTSGAIMKKLRPFIIFCLFVIVGIHGDTIYLHATPDYTSGTDSACQKFEQDLIPYTKLYNKIVFVNKGWIPSQKVIQVR